MRFKVGDKVRVKKDLEVGGTYGDDVFISDMYPFVGKVVTIANTMHSGAYRIKEYAFTWTEEMLEPIGFCKDLLSDGVIVKRKDGSFAIVIGEYLYSKTGHSFLNNYDDKLHNNACVNDGLDIIGVYEPNGMGDIKDLLNGEYLDLIAERPAEVKKMTLKEICEELGYDVEIIKEEK